MGATEPGGMEAFGSFEVYGLHAGRSYSKRACWWALILPQKVEEILDLYGWYCKTPCFTCRFCLWGPSFPCKSVWQLKRKNMTGPESGSKRSLRRFRHPLSRKAAGGSLVLNGFVRRSVLVVGCGVLLLGNRISGAADTQIVLARHGGTVVLEPYAPNIVRVTLSLDKASALAAPGYGFVGAPSMTGWSHDQDSGGYDVIRSGQMVIHIAPENLPPASPHGAR